MDVPVTLIVKAPNQQFEDQTIKCEQSWTIRRLKGYLSEVYPCKPKTDEQKLIYSGQLLHDTVVLKDVLRQYEEPINDSQQIHTVHLVFTPKTNPNSQTTSYSNNNSTLCNNTTTTAAGTATTGVAAGVADGLRHRNIGSTAAPTINPAVYGSGGVMGGVNFQMDFQQQINTNMAAQQIAMQNWMHSAYSQYLNQYMNLMSMGVRPESLYAQQTTGGNIPNIPSFYAPHLSNPVISPQSQPNLQTPIISPQPPQQAQPPVNAVPDQNDGAGGAQQPGVGGVAAAAAGAEIPPLPGQDVQDRPQPRFPHIVQEEQPENRDWLDMFYTMSRLMILLVLVYFYSSPLRCLLVLLIALILYLYHIGVLRFNNQNNIRRPPVVPNAQNNNNAVVENNNNNVAPGAANPAGENRAPAADGGNEAAPADQVNNQREDDVAEQQPLTENISNPIEGEADAETRSILAFVRSFVVSFFTSLIPETPAL